MKCVPIHLPALLLMCSWACAQEPGGALLDPYLTPGMEVTGIRAPYYGEGGQLKAELYGGRAKVLGEGVAEITHLRIDVYEKGEVAMVLYAPQCRVQIQDASGAARKTLAVESDGKVLIDMDRMVIAGRGFRFNSAHNRFEILHDSKAIVKKAGEAWGELEL